MKWPLVIFAALANSGFSGENSSWTKESPREEIAPLFKKTDDQTLKLTAQQKGTNGHWKRIFPVEGGKSYRFQATRFASQIDHPRRSCVARIEWFGENGQKVASPHKVNPNYFGKETAAAQPDFPGDKQTNQDGSVLVEEIYKAPEKATEAHVQLHLR